jgi:hypothetical protein
MCLSKQKKSHATVPLMPSFLRARVLLDRSQWQKPTQVKDVLQINYISEIILSFAFH